MRLCALMLDRTPATPYEHVVRAHLDGRVLHFNGADCYIITPEGDLMVTSTATSPARMELYMASEAQASRYISSNAPRPPSLRQALSIARGWWEAGLLHLPASVASAIEP